MTFDFAPYRIAAIIPCRNEAGAIGRTVADVRAALPSAAVFVFDNNSTDDSADEARAAGAETRFVRLAGKGNVVRRMFADVDADIYLMLDGDATYDAGAAPILIERLIRDRLDMVVGCRVSDDRAAYRLGHVAGNRLLTACVGLLFGRAFKDLLSGYRVFSRRYVKSFPVASRGFEIETELSVHALSLQMPIGEIETPYGARQEGSVSKLNTWRDGLRILRTVVRLVRHERPLMFFSVGMLVCLTLSLALAIPLFETYLQTGLVPRFPTAILCSALVLLGFLLLVCGLVLDTVTTGRLEAKRLAYLQVPTLNGS